VRTAEAATASEVGCGVGDWGTVRRCHVGGFGVAQSLAGDGFDVLLLCYCILHLQNALSFVLL
jgi:hypothetical protein